MKEKMRKVRYPMLIVWGIFMGAAGTAGVKSSWHVIPGWLIGVIVILGIMVMLIGMISGKIKSILIISSSIICRKLIYYKVKKL